MKVFLVAALLVPSLAASQPQVAAVMPESVFVRSVDTTRVVSVRVEMQGQLMGSIGIYLPDTGRVELRDSRGIATTPVYLDLRPLPGRLNLTAIPRDRSLSSLLCAVLAQRVVRSRAGIRSC